MAERSTAASPCAVAPARATVRSELVSLPGGTFIMGCDRGEGHPADREGPTRRVEVEPFSIGICTVTNADFDAFVTDTGYVTDAETFGWSFVFGPFVTDPQPDVIRGHADGAPWWLAVTGATWRTPFGPGSTWAELESHPVVHVSWRDAVTYCEWACMRLPTEAEWEYAARGGLDGKRYPWGDELRPGGNWALNIWQGSFPGQNTEEDGYRATAPVRTFEPNGYGLYQCVGNVWEWTADHFDPETSVPSELRAMRGGSYLCHDSYCNRYRVAARSANTANSSSGNLGFRCVGDVAPGDEIALRRMSDSEVGAS